MKTIKYSWLFTICLYTIVYLFYTFIQFRFENPFQWFLNIPNLSPDDRGFLLFGWITYYLIVTIVMYNVISEYETKRKQENCKHENCEAFSKYTKKCIDCKKLLDV